jgi:putative transposase
MNFDPFVHGRRSIRLPGYDYSVAGAYFITICTHQREHLFGKILDGEMQESKIASIVRSHWLNLSRHYANLITDEFIIMPDHIHGIMILKEASINNVKSIPNIIQEFKTFSARKINITREQKGIPVWQRNYYESVIRTTEGLDNVRKYIVDNPRNWDESST